MPTYEYECTKCSRRFEMFQSITAKALRKFDTDCEQCNNKAPVIRLLGGGAAVIFKGSGFYQTDYRSDGYKKAAEAEKKSTTESKSDKKSDSAPAKSTDTKSIDKNKKNPSTKKD